MKKQTILVINPKGGSGKTTIATNLASYYAIWNIPVALADYDPQQSSGFWLNARPAELPKIEAIKNINSLKGNRQIKRVIIDAPAGTPSKQVKLLMQAADKIIIPVLPSPIDMHAVNQFLENSVDGLSKTKKQKITLIANRYKSNTLAFNELYQYLNNKEAIHFVAMLRDSQNYSKAYQYGMGIFEFAPYYVDHDITQWLPLLDWLEAVD